MRARITALLPPGVHVATLDAVEESSANLSRAYRVNLNVLALVALFTGGLLVFSTQALAVVRRRSQLALLRVLGMTRRELASLLVLEGAIVGIVGSALGVAGGFILAQIAVRIIGVQPRKDPAVERRDDVGDRQRRADVPDVRPLRLLEDDAPDAGGRDRPGFR